MGVWIQCGCCWLQKSCTIKACESFQESSVSPLPQKLKDLKLKISEQFLCDLLTFSHYSSSTLEWVFILFNFVLFLLFSSWIFSSLFFFYMSLFNTNTHSFSRFHFFSMSFFNTYYCLWYTHLSFMYTPSSAILTFYLKISHCTSFHDYILHLP